MVLWHDAVSDCLSFCGFAFISSTRCRNFDNSFLILSGNLFLAVQAISSLPEFCWFYLLDCRP